MLSDIEIAQQHRLIPIEELGRQIGLAPEEIEPYGRDKAKVNLTPRQHQGKLILVTASSGMPAGSGKTTTSIALAQGLKVLGKRATLALREPSLGPVFGMKGGAAGGGYSQVVPMEAINLHFTGDFHAITAANNLLSSMIENAIHFKKIRVKEVIWKRVMDVNDRSLRHIVTGLGGTANGSPRETGFDITAASELMAILCLSENLDDLRERIGRIVVAIDEDNKPILCDSIGATGAMVALLKEAIKPNLVQSLEGNAAFVHGGPFANIAHGCNTLVATRAALMLGDYAITEAGFGADLGAEKFLNIKCRHAGLKPDLAVLVTSTKALKWHGGANVKELSVPNVEAVKKGLPNLTRHIENLQKFGLPVVVSINHFASDTEEELAVLDHALKAMNVPYALSDGFVAGGEGAKALAQTVLDTMATQQATLNHTYELDDDLITKLDKVAKSIYRAGKVVLSEQAKKDLKRLQDWGYDKLPICVAKTPYSFSHDPSLQGAPEGYELPVQRLILNAGAGFIVITTGDIMRMPGLPKVPAAESISVVDNRIVGLM